jgi:sugar diacid utilization regulator
VLRYGLNVHRSLVELLYRGAGLAALCHQMARLSNSAVAVLDPQLRVLAFEQSRSRVLEPGAIAAGLRSLIGDTTVDPGVGHVRPEICVLDMDGVALTCVLTPILLGGRHDGWVVVIEADDQPHPHDLAEHRVVVEQGATIIGTEMLRMRSVEQAEERARGDFVHALLHGRFATQHELEARATHYDFPILGTYGVIVAGNISSLGVESLSALFQLARDTTRLAPQPGVHTLATVVGDVLAVIRQVDVGERPGGAVDSASRQLAEFAGVLQQELVRRLHHPVAVAYGRSYQGAERIYDSYREARLTLGLNARLKLSELCGFEDLRVYATLTDLAASDAGRAFARDMLAPLRRGRAGGELEEAVIAYIASGGNINATARELHIHRNTMLYKLDRASRLLRVDLRQAEQQFAVWLAHKLDLLAETSMAVDRDVHRS